LITWNLREGFNVDARLFFASPCDAQYYPRPRAQRAISSFAEAGLGTTFLELHQVRYFLSLSNTLNFTRAAEECNVSQPALSRAIAQLEAELGGDLFRRERKLTHLTDLGRAVLPPLRQCFEANQQAKELAQNFLKAGHAPLNLALSRTIDMDQLSPTIAELGSAFPNIEIRVFRGSGREVVERLRHGDAEIAIAGPLPEEWERFDTKHLFEQRFGLLINKEHPLSRKNGVELEDLSEERLLSRSECELMQILIEKLQELGVLRTIKHEVNVLEDIPGLVQANFGLGIWPVDRHAGVSLQISELQGLALSRSIRVYTVFGRRLSVAGTTLTRLLRARDWSDSANGSPGMSELIH